MKKITIWTDGSCLGNPGPGGWAYLMLHGEHEKEGFGSEKHTTNNRMELFAVVSALRDLKMPCEADIYTDSTYVQQGMKSWIAKWKKNGWKTSAGKPVMNQDIWMLLDAEALRHKLAWHWVKGHHESIENNRVDVLARHAAEGQNCG